MFVDPRAPTVEVLGPALLGNRLERANPYPVVKRNGNGSDLVRIRIRVLQYHVTTALAVLPIIKAS
jgi:hypothetical protein